MLRGGRTGGAASFSADVQLLALSRTSTPTLARWRSSRPAPLRTWAATFAPPRATLPWPWASATCSSPANRCGHRGPSFCFSFPAKAQQPDTVASPRPRPCQVYKLRLSYAFSMEGKAEVRPMLQNLSDFLYEGATQNQLWFLHNKDGQASLGWLASVGIESVCCLTVARCLDHQSGRHVPPELQRHARQGRLHDGV